MNEFYRGKASLPRQVRNADNIRVALTEYRERRLSHVVNACADSDDQFRVTFSEVHDRYASVVHEMTDRLTDDELTSWLTDEVIMLQDEFDASGVTGATREAIALIGAELEMMCDVYYDTGRGKIEK